MLNFEQKSPNTVENDIITFTKQPINKILAEPLATQ